MAKNIRNKSVSKNITFSSDGFLLKGTLHLPAQEQPPVVVGSHGLLSSGNSPKQIALARKCNKLGIAFFRFDHRGCGSSEGVFRDVSSFDARCNDLISAIKTVQARNDIGNKIGLWGSSMGGAVCISTASILSIDALVTFAAPMRSNEIVDTLEKPEDSDISSSEFFEKKFLFDNTTKLSNIHNILIFHGEMDNIVPVSHALEIHENVSEPKRLILQERGDHRMSNKEHQNKFILEAAFWFKTCFASL